MEFGKINNILFIIIPIIIMVVMILGYQKKKKILKILRLKENKFIEILKIILLSLGSLFLVIALLSPQKQIDGESIEIKGLNIYALVDTSRSMLTEDVYPNRMDKAKDSLYKIIMQLKGDRIGIIPFSDSAYVQMPLTDDYSITKNYIDAIDTNLISGGGTNLYKAIVLAEKSFEKSGTKDKNIIIFSDGGEESSKILDYIKKNKINVFSVGVGTSSGGVVPLYKNGRKIGFIKDKNGNPVVSRLNFSFLEKISKKYYLVNNLNDDTIDFIKDIRTLNRENSRTEDIKTYKKYFQFPLFLGLLLILIGYFINGGIKDEE